MKPVYAFDIDGILCHTREIHRTTLETELGVTLADGGHYDAFGFHHDDEAVVTRVREIAMDTWRRPTVFANGAPSGQDVLQALVERGQFAGYVTRRHPNLRSDTYTWLQSNTFPVVIDQAEVTRYYGSLHHMLGDVESKAAPAREMGADTLVEDSPKEALMAARDGLKVVVLRLPYNADFEQECKAIRITRGGESIVRGRICFIDSLEELL